MLDDLELLAALDPQGMYDHIAALPRQCSDAWKRGMSTQFPEGMEDVRAVLIVGMGGSAIGGDLAASLLKGSGKVPVMVERGYDVPAWVDSNTLVIGSSYSGNTEETLSAFSQAHRKGAKLLAITTGGKLKELADRFGAPVVKIDYKSPPRGALGYSFSLILASLAKLGLAPDLSREMADAVETMEDLQRSIRREVPEDRNPAKQLARRVFGRMPMVMGGPLLAAVARRWKGQFNENSKTWAQFDELPEWDHNGILGLKHPKSSVENSFVIYLKAAAEPDRVGLRWEISRGIIESAGVQTYTFDAPGSSALAQMLSAVHFGDFVSFYLAALNGVNPTEMAAIENLKRELAKR